ncbi:hypothetical protein BRC69_05510 [Halobacteriales archaeon QH_6_66_25]|nr:MAG: hypothetical protein BRC69_05510 [Halobacteriales archaeon QH_6_66_25]
MWVRSEYASELAVLSAWIAVLLPWNVAYQPNAPPDGQASIYFFRFALFEIQFRRPWVVEVNGLYVREDAVAAKLPVSEVRLMGGLLAVGAVGTVGASALYLTARDSTGVPIPVGALVVAVLAVVLLRTEEVDPDG